jgi:hypothetical protein
MTWTRRRWISAFAFGALATFGAALRTRRAAAATPTTPRRQTPRSAERVEYRTRWIGHF